MRTIDRRRAERNVPPAPRLPSLPGMPMTQTNLAEHNALAASLAPVGPRPAAPVINLPTMAIPQGNTLPLSEIVLGGGFGQGVVPNSPRPAPAVISAARINVPVDVVSADYKLSSYDLTWDGLTPENQYLRPSHNLEIYGPGSSIDVTHLDRVRPEEMMPRINNHGVDETFGGNPAFEVDRNAIRPTNPRIFSAPPRVNTKLLRSEPKRIPVAPRPIIPAPTGPRSNPGQLAAKMIGRTKPIRLEAQYVAPPVRSTDLGGLGNSVNRGFGVGIGRAFGADANLMH